MAAGPAGHRLFSPCPHDIEIWVDDADPVTTATLVQNALDHNAAAAGGSEVSVDTYGNTVTLTGHVRTGDEHDAVAAAAWMATGVLEVVDLPRIRGMTSRPG